MLYSICIVTYRRPELLEKLLESLSKPKLPESVEIEVIIVDNEESEIAKEVVERAREKHGLIWILNLASNWGKVVAVFGYHLVENEL